MNYTSRANHSHPAKNGESSVENIVVLILIFVLVVISIQSYMKIVKSVKTTSYIQEVKEFNMALLLYRVKYGKFPKNLSVLLKTYYIRKIKVNGKIQYIKERFINIKRIKLNKNGYPLTPFGKVFFYDRKEGRVLFINKSHKTNS